MRKKLVTPIVVVAAIASLVGCTINITVPPSMDQEMLGSETTRAMDEVQMFAEMMIPHHQQAIDMAQLALNKESSSADLRDLSQRIIDGQTPEIALMEGWLEDSGEEGAMGLMSRGGEMMMGGMASPEEMDNLSELEGSDFEAEFLSLMITHHEGALRMVHMIDESAHDEAAQLAKDIVRVQTAEIEEMKLMRSRGTGA
jgi:uncharacterized protein (DUF305 family)